MVVADDGSSAVCQVGLRIPGQNGNDNGSGNPQAVRRLTQASSKGVNMNGNVVLLHPTPAYG